MDSHSLFGLSTGEVSVLLQDLPNATSQSIAESLFADVPSDEIVALMGVSTLAARELVQPSSNGDYELQPPVKQLQDLFREARFWMLCSGTRGGELDAVRILASQTLVAAFQKRAFGTYFGTVVEKSMADPEPPSIPALAALEDFMQHCEDDVTTQLFTNTAPVAVFTGPHKSQLEQLRARIG